MSARGDMMPKPLNLTDMLLQRTDGQTQDRAQDAGKSRANPRTVKRAQTEFIPEQAKPSRKADNGHDARLEAPKTFHERVKDSQAKLARKEHTFFKQPGARPVEHPAVERSQGNAKAPKAREVDASHTQDVTEAHKPANEAAKTGRKDSAKARDAEASGWSPKECRPVELEAAGSAGVQEASAGEGWENVSDENGELDYDALKSRLDELGIGATADQLQDPAFLAQMLWMIDAVPMAGPLIADEAAVAAEGVPADLIAPVAADGAAPEVIAVGVNASATADPATTKAAIATNPTAGALPADDSAPLELQAAESTDWTAIAEPEREEIAALIREKLGTLAEKPEFRAGPEATAEKTLPVSVRMARAGAEIPMQAVAPKADLILADPDRLRVLQNAGLTSSEGRPAQVEMAFGTSEDEMSESADGADGFGAGLSEASRNPGKGDAKRDESMPDLMGRNPQAAENAGPKDAAMHKDAAPTHFQAAIEQARAGDAKAAPVRAPELHQPAVHEQTVLAQIARKMSALSNRSTEEISIQLEPENLGRVRIALEMRGGALTARIGVENDSVRQIVDANIAGLKESLESQGIKLQGLEVSVEQRHESLFNPEGSNAREFFQRRGQGGNAPEGDVSLDSAAETDTGRRLGYNTMEYIA